MKIEAFARMPARVHGGRVSGAIDRVPPPPVKRFIDRIVDIDRELFESADFGVCRLVIFGECDQFRVEAGSVRLGKIGVPCLSPGTRDLIKHLVRSRLR